MGIALCIQTHGSLLNWQPHIHALVTDGGFRPDGGFVRLPAHATDALTEVLRRPVLRRFVERELLEPEVIDNILKHLRTKGRDARAGPWATGLSPPADAAAEGVARARARVWTPAAGIETPTPIHSPYPGRLRKGH